MIKKMKYLAIGSWLRYGGIISPRIAAHSAYLLFTKPIRRLPGPNDTHLVKQANALKELFEGALIHGYSFGNSERIVLLAHGWNTHALSMRAFIKPLLSHGLRVIVFDAPSHGHSEGGRGSAPIYKRFLDQVITKYQPESIIAHSLGGLCSLIALAGNNCHQVKKIAVLSMPASSDSILNQFLELSKLHRFAQKHFLHYVKTRMQVQPRDFNLDEVYQDNVPLNGLIVHDLQDWIIPYSDAEAVAKIWPDATLVTTQNLGHSGILKDQRSINKIINFITQK